MTEWDRQTTQGQFRSGLGECAALSPRKRRPESEESESRPLSGAGNVRPEHAGHGPAAEMVRPAGRAECTK